MDIEIGRASVNLRIASLPVKVSIGGGGSSPSPAPDAIYSDFAPYYIYVLAGSITSDFEEVD